MFQSRWDLKALVILLVLSVSSFVVGEGKPPSHIINFESLNSFLFSQDGTRIVLGAERRGVIQILEVGSWKVIKEIKVDPLGDFSSLRIQAMSRDAKYFSLGSYEEVPKLLDLENKAYLTLVGQGYITTSSAFLSDHTLLTATFAGVDREKKLVEWGLPGGEMKKKIPVARKQIWSLGLSPSGSQVAVGADEKASLWDLRTSKKLFEWEDPTAISFQRFAFSQKKAMLVGGTDKGNALIWDTKSGECIRTLKAHSSDITAVAFNASDTHLVTTSADGWLRIWNLDTGKRVAEYYGLPNVPPATQPIAITSDGQWVAFRRDKDSIEIWDLRKEFASP